MKTNWDYTNLADAYLNRPNYSESAIKELITLSNVNNKSLICDVGAGIAHLTLMFLKKGFSVIAIEPNDAMRNHGIKRTKKFELVTWHEGTGENTGQPDNIFDLVSFGSSFNVTDRSCSLRETNRILKNGGWFACMWNHRNINDPIQSQIEAIIKENIPNYKYGTRREDQAVIINESDFFVKVHKIEGDIIHKQSINDCIGAWKSHATLERQAGKKFSQVINQIEKYLKSLNTHYINIPYTTRIWAAQKK